MDNGFSFFIFGSKIKFSEKSDCKLYNIFWLFQAMNPLGHEGPKKIYPHRANKKVLCMFNITELSTLYMCIPVCLLLKGLFCKTYRWKPSLFDVKL